MPAAGVQLLIAAWSARKVNFLTVDQSDANDLIAVLATRHGSRKLTPGGIGGRFGGCRALAHEDEKRARSRAMPFLMRAEKAPPLL